MGGIQITITMKADEMAKRFITFVYSENMEHLNKTLVGDNFVGV